MSAPINRIAVLLLLAFGLLAGALGYWAASGPALVARPDNPRRILAEQRSWRGPIVDRDGEVIVETVGEPGAYTRHSLYPNGAPFTGYYSINYGASEIERAFDGVLRGTLGVDPAQAQIDDLLHVSPIGRAVQLTIDLDVQRIADALLASESNNRGLAGRTGAIVVLSVPDGDVLALSSQPTFDPNTLDDNWDRLRVDPAAPLLNRAAQGAYQPGAALQLLVLSEALRQGAASLGAAPEFPDAPMAIDSQALACLAASRGEVVTLADAFRAACPGPFADLGAALGSDALWALAARWGLTETQVIGIESAAPLTQTIRLTDTRALREFAAGQGPLTVTPLQMARVAATLAARGAMPATRIVSAIQAVDGAWLPVDRLPARRVLPVGIADQVASAMARDDDRAWHAGIGLSGSSRLLWFIGFAPIDDPSYAVAILIEHQADSAASDREAIEIGERLLAAVSR
jgi:peptidoglycan glycosyltransferase